MFPGFDRFQIVSAYYHVASEHHSGQWSSGYRKLSTCARLGFKPGCCSGRNCPEDRAAMAALLWKRRREIVKTW